MFVTQKVSALQYDGTNAAEVAAAMSSYEYEEVDGNLILRNPWGRPVTVTPTDWCCYGTVYPDRAALEQAWYVLPDPAPVVPSEPTP
ncbi:hypothetical protein [Micromonospora sp. NPDC023633]|uniref:hypothetical protein n=1 Tax=Micromonospora sp. NPDC023633 TaxID=3154320 RepID=UPI0033D2BB21